MSKYDFSSATIEYSDLTEEMLLDLAKLAIPNFANAALEPAVYKAVVERQHQLVAFWQQHQIQPIPAFEQLVLVYRKNNPAQIPASFISGAIALAKHGFGTEFIAATEKVVSGKKVLVEKPEFKLIGSSLNMGAFSPSVSCTSYNEKTHKDLSRVYADNFGNLLMEFVSNQLQKLNAEQLVELIQILQPKVKNFEENKSSVLVTGNNGNGFFADLSNGQVSIGNSRERCLTAMASFSIGDVIAPSTHALFLLSLIAGKDVSSIRNKVNCLPNLWQREPNYGVDMDDTDPTKVIMDNTPLPVKFVVRDENNHSLNVWPWIVPQNSKFELSLLEEMLQSQKAVVLDKYAMQFCGNDLAANAGLLGRRQIEIAGEILDQILTLHDASKPSKFFNRLTQARKHLHAHINGREQSNFYSVLGNGNLVAQSGIRLRTLLTNSRCAMGSGPAIFNPDRKLQVEVKKSLTFRVTYDSLSDEMRTALETKAGKVGDRALGMSFLKEKVISQLEQFIEEERVFSPGETVIKLEGKTFFINEMKNQPFVLKEVKKLPDFINSDKGYTPDSFEITVGIVLFISSAWFKLRNDGVKLTTIPYNVQFLKDGQSYDQQWDIILNNETRKGKVVEIGMYCLANGGGIYNANTGILTMLNGNIIDLTEKENLVSQWVIDNTVERVMQFQMAKAEWEIFLHFGLFDDVELIQDCGSYVIVQERIQVLEADYLYEVEISTPQENTGTCGMTPEQLAALSLQNKGLADTIYAESNPSRKSIHNLVNMITRETPVGVPSFLLTSKSDRESIATLVGSIKGLTHRQVVKAFAKAFPLGVNFITQSNNASGKENNLYLSFDVVMGLMTFVTGSAKGITLDVVAFLNYILNPDAKSVDGKINAKLLHLKSSLNGWLRTSMESNGVLKKAARTAKVCVTGKVRTSYSPILNHKEGDLPKVAINPSCAIAKLLATKVDGTLDPAYLVDGKFDATLLNGTIIGIGRTPMPFVTAAEVVITQEVGVAHLMLLPHIWAMSNEGDSDGDGIFAINLDMRGVTLEEALAMNSHDMGMNGYKVCYGEYPANWPCAEFSSYADKWGKKALVGTKVSSYVTAIAVEDYKTAAQNVSQHYKSAVGIAYGICSALTFKVADMSYQTDKEAVLSTYVRALAISWRLFYEGLGLAGYTPAAKKFFQVLALASTNAKEFILVDGVPTRVKKDTPKELKRFNSVDTLISTLEEATGGAFGLLKDKKQIVQTIVVFESIRAGRTALEQGKDSVQYFTQDKKNKIAVLTGLRSLGQGKNTAGVAELEALTDGFDEIIPQSPFTLVIKDELWNVLNCPWLAEMLEEGTKLHQTISRKLFALQKAEEESGY